MKSDEWHAGTATFDSGAPWSKAADENSWNQESIQADEDLELEKDEGVGKSHPGPRAKRFYRPTKDEISRHARKVVGLLLAVPFVVVAVRLVGTSLCVAGSVVGGIGDTLLRLVTPHVVPPVPAVSSCIPPSPSTMTEKGAKAAPNEVSSYEFRDIVLGKVPGFLPWPGMVS